NTGNVRTRDLSTLIAADQGLFLVPGVTPTVRLGSNLGAGEATNAIITNRTVTINAPGSLSFVNAGGNLLNMTNGGVNSVTLGNLGSTNVINGGSNAINGTTNINTGVYALTT